MLLILLFGLIAAGSANLDRYAQHKLKAKFAKIKNDGLFKITFTIELYNERKKLYSDKNLSVAIQLGDIGPAAGAVEMKDCRLRVDLSAENENPPNNCDGDYGVPYSIAIGDYQIGSLNGNYYTVWCPNIYFKEEKMGMRPCVKYVCEGTACSLSFPSGTDQNHYIYANFAAKPRDNVVYKYNPNGLIQMKTFEDVFPYTPCNLL